MGACVQCVEQAAGRPGGRNCTLQCLLPAVRSIYAAIGALRHLIKTWSPILILLKGLFAILPTPLANPLAAGVSAAPS